ncbi:MAG: stage V sporulation protein AC [Oscillospiraceae bacterium]|nr:stage V sporulation protein AC [Oscillospiraceae bacterium]
MISNKEYDKLVKKYSHKSPILKDCIKAFLIGGLICTIGQGLQNLYQYFGIDKDSAGSLVSVTLVFIGILLTYIGWYDDIARHGGAGTLIPITGFANSVASPAIEFKSEGLVLGLGVKMFVIAGPVLVYGISASVICGFILQILSLFGIKPL